MFFVLQFQLLIWMLIFSTSTVVVPIMSYVVDFLIVFQVLTFLPGFSAADRAAGGRRPPAVSGTMSVGGSLEPP
jgi:hypothetical protein